MGTVGTVGAGKAGVAAGAEAEAVAEGVEGESCTGGTRSCDGGGVQPGLSTPHDTAAPTTLMAPYVTWSGSACLRSSSGCWVDDEVEVEAAVGGAVVAYRSSIDSTTCSSSPAHERPRESM